MQAIKKIAEYVAQLRRVGKGHGTILNLVKSFVNLQPIFETTLLPNLFWTVFAFESPGVWHFDQMLLHEGEGAAA